MGALVVYALSVFWVFDERRLWNSRWEPAIFYTIGVVGLLITELILYALTDVLGVDYRFSKIIAAGSVFLINFWLRKRILFTRPSA
jgi:putative flippase GtrA